MVSKYGYLLVLLVILPILAGAQEDHIKLLAVVHDVEGMPGSVADLHLRIAPGTGKVFLSTKPLTKVDMQLSVQFAKQYACDYLREDCSNKDFYYTTRAVAPIVGGPSAGAAATALTIAVLQGVPINQAISVTGTINSGGSIGIVGGVPEKIGAAATQGIEKVLIPSWETVSVNDEDIVNISVFNGNKSLNVSTPIVKVKDANSPEAVAKRNNITLVRVSHIEEVLREFAIPQVQKLKGEIIVPDDYTDTMMKISSQLCQRAAELNNMLDEVENVNSTAGVFYNQSIYYLQQAKIALNNSDYYPAASYCFGSSIRARFLSFVQENVTIDELKNRIRLASKGIEKFRSELPKNISTISDLQALMVVKERVSDASRQLELAEEAADENRSIDAAYNVAYTIERLNSAKQWAEFFGRSGLQYEIDEESLRDACLNAIDEAQMRKQYINIFFPINVAGIDEGIDEAYANYVSGSYDQCIFIAGKTKAEAETLISSAAIGSEQNLKDLINEKLDIAEQVILEEQNRSIFPLLGYSYYDYAKSLMQTDPQSALIYAEYSLELSNMRMYFPESDSGYKIPIKVEFWYVYAFVLGFLCGMLVVLIFIRRARKKPSKKQ